MDIIAFPLPKVNRHSKPGRALKKGLLHSYLPVQQPFAFLRRSAVSLRNAPPDGKAP